MRKFLFALMATSVMASCSEHEGIDAVPNMQPHMQVNVGTRSAFYEDGRSIVMGEFLPDGSEIGVFFEGDNALTPGTYDDVEYKNCRFTATGENESQTWNEDPDKPILLSPSVGTAYAYYPYNPLVTDITRIPVDISKEQIDYMYAMPATTISIGNRNAYLVMQHALTAVRVIVTRGEYTHIGSVEDVQLYCEGLAQEATLNAKTGELTDLGTMVPIDKTYPDKFVVSEQLKVLESVIGVPTRTNGNVKISMTVDGRPYSFSTTTKFSQSKIYTYNISIGEKKLYLEGIQVDPWTSDESALGNGSIELPARIQILGDLKDITFQRTDDGAGKITLTCVPRYEGRAVKEPDVQTSTEAAAQCVTQSVDENTGIRTIVIDNPTSAITLNFHGIEPESSVQP